MPWWVIIYLVAYSVLLGFSVWDNVRGGESISYVVLDILCDATAIALVLAFWITAVAQSLGLLLPCIFAYSCAWLVYSAPHEIRKMRPDPELTQKESRVLRSLGVMVALTFAAPAYVWGAIASWQQIQKMFFAP
jgi:hypothetical protein